MGHGSVHPPYNQAFAVTPSNATDFTQGMCDALYVGGAGVVRAVFQNDATADFTAAQGAYLYLKAKRVNSTGTTATAIVALYLV